jgi:hypothetical protein
MMKKSLKWAGIAGVVAGTMLQLGGCGLLAPLGLGIGALALLGGGTSLTGLLGGT